MKIGLIVNFEKDTSLRISQKVVEFLETKVELFCDINTYDILGDESLKVTDKIFEVSDFCIIIGGDGTIIHNAKMASLKGKPVLGINAGRIGFLSGLEAEELHKLNLIIEDNFDIEERIMLDVKHISDGSVKNFIAFNDAVITKGSISRMLDIKCRIDNRDLKYRSDGLIIATPTGSTAYSMSAGGAVVDPTLENMIVTPICPYTYFTRSIVLPASKELFIQTEADDKKEAFLTIDGEVAVKLMSSDKISVSLSNTKVKLIKLKNDSIYDCLEKITGGLSK